MFTVDNLVTQVREQLQEANTKPVDDTTIINTLNRGNSYAWDIYARHYPEPLIERTAVSLSDDRTHFVIPEDAFEQRVQKVEMEQGGAVYGLERQSYRRTTPYRNRVVGSRPVFYSIRDRRVEVFPFPASTTSFQFYCHYVRRPDTLRPQQGQISSTVATDGVSVDASVVVDSIGSSLSTSDSYFKYVNFVNVATGKIKGSAEIKSISGNQITFKQTPTRTTVLGRTISGDIPSDLGIDDYITDIRGSCVIFLQQPTTNFLIQYAVSEIRRALGYDTGIEKSALKDFEDQVEHTWAGREASLRVKRSNRTFRRRRY